MALSPIFGAKEGVGVIRECLEKKKTMNGLHSAAAHAVDPPPPEVVLLPGYYKSIKINRKQKHVRQARRKP